MLTLRQFARLVAASKLVSEDALRAVLKRLPGESPSAEDLAQLLVQGGLLTEWQSKQIMLGRGKYLLLERRYRLVDSLGEGGMGAVFRAVDSKLEREVVVKIPRPEALANPNTLKRFHREALANGRLEHPNIVRALDVGREGNVHFIVMELVEGQDLEYLIWSGGPLAPYKAVDYIAQAAEALDFAHRHGVIHRDLKPSNLLVTRDGQVKLLDMGFARLLHREGDFSSPTGLSQEQLTRVGTMVGTLDYMAPEQAQDTRLADTRSDIYSLGCSLFELLTGYTPFVGANSFDLMMKHVNEPVPPIPGLDRGLKAILHKMMAKEPADRHQTPVELARELRAWQAEVKDHESAHQPLEPVAASSSAVRFSSSSVWRKSSGSAVRRASEQFDEPDFPDWLAAIKEETPAGHRFVQTSGRPGLFATLLVVAAIIAGAYVAWDQTQERRVIIAWPPQERAGGIVEVDGEHVPFPADGSIAIARKQAAWTVRLSRPGFRPLEYKFELPPQGHRTITPDWQALPAENPTPATDKLLRSPASDDPS